MDKLAWVFVRGFLVVIVPLLDLCFRVVFYMYFTCISFTIEPNPLTTEKVSGQSKRNSKIPSLDNIGARPCILHVLQILDSGVGNISEGFLSQVCLMPTTRMFLTKIDGMNMWHTSRRHYRKSTVEQKYHPG
jgi:hypothetical protein